MGQLLELAREQRPGREAVQDDDVPVELLGECAQRGDADTGSDERDAVRGPGARPRFPAGRTPFAGGRSKPSGYGDVRKVRLRTPQHDPCNSWAPEARWKLER